MSPTRIESIRRWFLGLPQLQKMLVFGGLGLLSGWVTTLSIAVWAMFPDVAVLPVLTAAIMPGLSFGLIVVRPIFFLSFGSYDRWLRTMPKIILLHTAAGISLPAASYRFFDEVRPGGALVALILLAAGFGFLLGVACSPRRWQREWGTVMITSVSVAVAAIVILFAVAHLPRLMNRVPKWLWPIYGPALCFITVHVLTAVALSCRTWGFGPALEIPPRLDDSSTLPP